MSAAETLALGESDFEERWNTIRELLQEVIGENRKGLFVFLGHAMQDPCFHRYLTEESPRLRNWKFLWVVPEAEASGTRQDGLAAGWIQLLSEHSDPNERSHDVAGPLAGRALDFATDLYTEYVDEASVPHNAPF